MLLGQMWRFVDYPEKWSNPKKHMEREEAFIHKAVLVISRDYNHIHSDMSSANSMFQPNAEFKR